MNYPFSETQQGTEMHETELVRSEPLREFYRGERRINKAFDGAHAFYNLYRGYQMEYDEYPVPSAPSAEMKRNLVESFVQAFVNGRDTIRSAFTETFGGSPEIVWQDAIEFKKLDVLVDSIIQSAAFNSSSMRQTLADGDMVVMHLIALYSDLYLRAHPELDEDVAI